MKRSASQSRSEDVMATPSRNKKFRLFNDPVHGHIELNEACQLIVDTKQFQRLRNIKQLGFVDFVFPGATHTRFEHALGTYHLAGKFLRSLKEYPILKEVSKKMETSNEDESSHISETDILCVEIAGLCHDLGCGPLSTFFSKRFLVANENDSFVKKWLRSRNVLMFEHMLKINSLEEKLERKFGLIKKDITFIKELIGGYECNGSTAWPYKGGRNEKQAFLYEIVSNHRNGVDVCKFDYMARDCHNLGIVNNFDAQRYMEFARIIEVDGEIQICTRKKELGNLYNMFFTRYNLHKFAYQHPVVCGIELISNNDDDTDVEDLDDDNEFIIKQSSRAGKKQCKRRRGISSKVSAVLDRTNTSTKAATMILASAFNEAGSSTSTVVLSKSTVHRQRQQRRKVAALEIKTTYVPSISVVHWDGKLIPDLCHTTTSISDRIAILLSSLNDGNVKLLGVPKLQSGSGQAAANAVVDNLKSWSCESKIIGMCFHTTAANTGKVKGACKLLEVALGRNLLWLACRHHMFEVLLADVFTACLGPSTGPEIAIFKLLRDNWSKIHHESKHIFPLIVVSDTVKAFISKELQQKQLREDYRELIALAARAVGLDVSEPIRKPGAIHRARWMAKAIYSLKMQLLLDGNENVLQLTDQQLQGIQRFNHFVLKVYIQSWFTCCSAVDAAVNDISLINRLHDYEEVHLCKIGLMMIKRHSWYLSNEMATLCLFSDLVSLENKAALVTAMISERGPHLLTTLPDSITDLQISREFFTTTRINCSFLDIPVKDWPHNNDYNDALRLTKNLKCVNDSAERGVALIQKFSAAAVDEEQKQFLLQVVEKYRQDFASCNREDLEQI
ncbi:deoxynucleoside triphosphate triphosphohydrolase SAMHD1 [Biomphalaria pfeifferi]|uniref:Deoxynucleoside triphosphate triphosphohydrolase SAMHD1 n=1 Tax=Biomphalaria pfeifferi TaxID=112525 RepID=A0AAD8BZD6_BIOPF|nr:deoxynucleoside triphosphate triphosphohydrolase SAMHD1 [Biomphalaria pfeifferi]